VRTNSLYVVWCVKWSKLLSKIHDSTHNLLRFFLFWTWDPDKEKTLKHHPLHGASVQCICWLWPKHSTIGGSTTLLWILHVDDRNLLLVVDKDNFVTINEWSLFSERRGYSPNWLIETPYSFSQAWLPHPLMWRNIISCEERKKESKQASKQGLFLPYLVILGIYMHRN
jgi:hypothetical protein